MAVISVETRVLGVKIKKNQFFKMKNVLLLNFFLRDRNDCIIKKPILKLNKK